MGKVSPSNVHAWAKRNLPKDEIDAYRGDLYLKKTPNTDAMIRNLWDERYSKPHTFRSQKDNEVWYEFPFSALGDYVGAKYHPTKKTRRA